MKQFYSKSSCLLTTRTFRDGVSNIGGSCVGTGEVWVPDVGAVLAHRAPSCGKQEEAAHSKAEILIVRWSYEKMAPIQYYKCNAKRQIKMKCGASVANAMKQTSVQKAVNTAFSITQSHKCCQIQYGHAFQTKVLSI